MTTNATEYDFLEHRRVEITYYNKKNEKTKTLKGYVIQVTHTSDFYATIHVVQNNGKIGYVTPRHCNIKNVEMTIIGWDPKNSREKVINEEEERFHLMDMEE